MSTSDDKSFFMKKVGIGVGSYDLLSPKYYVHKKHLQCSSFQIDQLRWCVMMIELEPSFQNRTGALRCQINEQGGKSASRETYRKKQTKRQKKVITNPTLFPPYLFLWHLRVNEMISQLEDMKQSKVALENQKK